jgi:hypothetical protein
MIQSERLFRYRYSSKSQENIVGQFDEAFLEIVDIGLYVFTFCELIATYREKKNRQKFGFANTEKNEQESEW